MQRVGILVLLLLVCLIGLSSIAISRAPDDSANPEPKVDVSDPFGAPGPVEDARTPDDSAAPAPKGTISGAMKNVMFGTSGPQAERNQQEERSRASYFYEEDEEPPLVLRVYDVSDLLTEIPLYPATPLGEDSGFLFPRSDEVSDAVGRDSMLPLLSPYDMYPHNGQLPPRRGANSSLDMEALRNAIVSFVSPNSWNEVGGESSAGALGDSFVVRTTEKDHQQIGFLLMTLRRQMASRKMVSVETNWLWLTKEQLATLGTADGEVPHVLEDADWKRLLLAQAEAKEDCEVREGYHATITCLNGQTVSVLAGRQKRFIISVIPVVGQFYDYGFPPAEAVSPAYTPSGAVGYQPVVTIVQEGAAIEVRPITCGGDQVFLDIHARVVKVESTERDEEPTSPPDTGKPTSKPTDKQGTVVRELAKNIDRPVLMTHRLDTTIRATAGRHMLVGGITSEVEPQPGEPNLYLFVKPVIHQSPKAKAKPAGKQ